MALDVLIRKLNYLRQLLADLAPYQGATLAQVQADHYKLERLFELLVVAAVDLLQHFLSEQQIVPESYRDTFALAATKGFIPSELAERLQEAVRDSRSWLRRFCTHSPKETISVNTYLYPFFVLILYPQSYHTEVPKGRVFLL